MSNKKCSECDKSYEASWYNTSGYCSTECEANVKRRKDPLYIPDYSPPRDESFYSAPYTPSEDTSHHSSHSDTSHCDTSHSDSCFDAGGGHDGGAGASGDW